MKISIINKHKSLILILLFSALPRLASAQESDMSPYSHFGIGDLCPNLNPRNMAMGGTSLALSGSRNVSYYNPATYVGIDSMSIIFDFGVALKAHQLEQKTATGTIHNQATDVSIANLNLYIPITKWLKFSAGLMPVSNIGYSVSEAVENKPNMSDFKRIYNGGGGLSEAYFGTALKYENFSVGVNVNRVFGNKIYRSMLVFVSDSNMPYPNSSEYVQETDIRGWNFDMGFLYMQPISKTKTIALGLTYQPAYGLHAEKSGFGTGAYKAIDTAFLINGVSGSIKCPAAYGVGVSFTENEKWMLAGDFTWSNWSSYSSFGMSEPALKQGNAWRLSLGFEKCASRTAETFLGRVAYRAGTYSGESYVDFEKEGLSQIGITFGVGIPIKRSYSMINIGFEYGQQGSLNKGQIKDDYVRISLGISAFERWFMRPKFD